MKPFPICLRLLWQLDCRAFSRAWAKTGKRMAARMAMMAMTTSNSMSVKPLLRLFTIPSFVGVASESPGWQPHAGYEIGDLMMLTACDGKSGRLELPAPGGTPGNRELGQQRPLSSFEIIVTLRSYNCTTKSASSH